jgi:hypothetical protein
MNYNTRFRKAKAKLLLGNTSFAVGHELHPSQSSFEYLSACVEVSDHFRILRGNLNPYFRHFLRTCPKRFSQGITTFHGAGMASVFWL